MASRREKYVNIKTYTPNNPLTCKYNRVYSSEVSRRSAYKFEVSIAAISSSIFCLLRFSIGFLHSLFDPEDGYIPLKLLLTFKDT